MSDLTNQPALRYAFEILNGAAREIGWDEIRAAAPENAYRWIALNRHHPDAERWLRAESGLPETAVEALLAAETRPRATRIGGGHVAILRGVNLNPGAQPEDMISLRAWLEPGRLVTVQLRRLKALADARAALDAPELIPLRAGGLFALIADRLVERMEPVIREYLLTVDKLEEESLASVVAPDIREKLARLRHDVLILRRFIAPQRDVLNYLSLDQTAPFDEQSRIDLRETADRVARIAEELESARERASVVQDQLASQRAEEMNRNMLILSVAAAIFLPLSFLTGLLGINVGGMPGTDSPVAFWIVVGLCLALGLALFLYFRRRRWL